MLAAPPTNANAAGTSRQSTSSGPARRRSRTIRRAHARGTTDFGLILRAVGSSVGAATALPTTRTSAETRRGMASAGKSTRTAPPPPPRLAPPPPVRREEGAGEAASPSHAPGGAMSPPGASGAAREGAGVDSSPPPRPCRHGCNTDAGAMPRQTRGPSTAASGHTPSAPEQTRRWCHVSSPRARTRGLASQIASSRATAASRGRLRAAAPSPTNDTDGEYPVASTPTRAAALAPPTPTCIASSRIRAAATAAMERKRTDGPKGRATDTWETLLSALPAPPPLVTIGARGGAARGAAAPERRRRDGAARGGTSLPRAPDRALLSARAVACSSKQSRTSHRMCASCCVARRDLAKRAMKRAASSGPVIRPVADGAGAAVS